jgi:integrase
MLGRHSISQPYRTSANARQARLELAVISRTIVCTIISSSTGLLSRTPSKELEPTGLGHMADLSADSSYVDAARSANTVRGYDADWRHFAAWCARGGVVPCPADPRDVARYLVELVDGRRGSSGEWIERPRRVATLERRLAGIRQHHRVEGAPFDVSNRVLRDTWHGIRRCHVAAPRAKEPTVTEIVRELVSALPLKLVGVRDRAILLLGFAGALPRSELVAIDVADCTAHEDGLVITLRGSRTNPDGGPDEIGVPRGAHLETCPVRALEGWLAAAEIDEGPVFRPVSRYGTVRAQRLSPWGVARIIKRAVEEARAVARARGNEALAVSLDPARYAGHSLRSGFIISAAAAGVAERDIVRHTRHKRMEKLERYIRHATVLRHNAAAKVGL